MLFPTPVYVHDFTGDQLSSIQKEIAANLPNIETYKRADREAGNIVSTFRFANDTYVNDLNVFNLEITKARIMERVHEYAYTIGYKGNFLKLQGSWFNFFYKDSFYHDHVHPGVKVAGVYYYKTNEQDGKLRFTNPNPHMFFGNWPADGMQEESVRYGPRDGRLILWPAWLVHRVESNITNSERISIGINFD